MIELDLKPVCLFHAFLNILRPTEIPSFEDFVSADLDALDNVFKRQRLVATSCIYAKSYNGVTARLAQQLVNGLYDRCGETNRAKSIMLQLLSLKTRAPRMAMVKIVMGVLDELIFFQRRPRHIFIEEGELNALVNEMYTNYVTGLWEDVNPYQRAYVLEQITSWFTTRPELVKWDVVRSIMLQQMIDPAPGRSMIRSSAVKQLKYACEHSNDPEFAVMAANLFRELLVVFCETATTAGNMHTCRFALDVLKLCRPLQPYEWTLHVFQVLLDNAAPMINLTAAVTQLMIEHTPNALFNVMEDVQLMSPRNLRTYSRLFQMFPAEETWDTLIPLIRYRKVTIQSNYQRWNHIFCILDSVCAEVPVGKVYRVIYVMLTDYEIEAYKWCAKMLQKTSRAEILRPYSDYFKLLAELMRKSAALCEDDTDQIKASYGLQAMQVISEIIEKWDSEELANGGEALLANINLQNVPLCLAGRVRGHTRFRIAEQTRNLLNLLRDFSENYEEFFTKLDLLAETLEKACLSSFANIEQLVAVTHMLVQLYATFMAASKVPDALHGKFKLTMIYTQLEHDGFEEAVFRMGSRGSVTGSDHANIESHGFGSAFEKQRERPSIFQDEEITAEDFELLQRQLTLRNLYLLETLGAVPKSKKSIADIFPEAQLRKIHLHMPKPKKSAESSPRRQKAAQWSQSSSKQSSHVAQEMLRMKRSPRKKGSPMPRKKPATIFSSTSQSSLQSSPPR